MLIRVPHVLDPLASEVTPRRVFERRRLLMSGIAAGAAFAPMAQALAQFKAQPAPSLATRPSALSTTDKATTRKDATSYNNYYEFGTEKDDPAAHANTLRTRPWTVAVEGEVRRPKVFDLDELLKLAPIEERVYRMRCVEGWSMVIPWVGYSLRELIKKVEPLGNAKYVEFVTQADPKTMPFVGSRVLDWPYVEGLRLDEAMHPLTLLSFGMYGEVLPKQNGAPVRLVVPWKYGFKSSKSLVKIRFTDKQPATAWNKAAANEYGFYSNVNPAVDHPRWSQATERRIGEDGLLAKKRKTLMFNGYEAQVGQMYAGMDLKKFI